MKTTFALFILFLSLYLTSCTEPRESVHEDRMERVQIKIDRGMYDESISDIEEILKKEPENERARVILASVFVRRAGIAVKDYFIIHEIFSKTNEVEEDVLDLELLKKLGVSDEKIEPWLKALSEINEAAKLGHKISRKIEQIPSVDEAGAKDIYLALLELEKLKKDKAKPGSLLYRGIIKVIYFKYMWNAQKLIPAGEGRFCAQKISELGKRLDSTRSFMVGMVEDVAHGFPESKADLLKTAKELDENFKGAHQFVKIFEEPNKTVKQALKVDGFKCDF